jgi:hypothetical protein
MTLLLGMELEKLNPRRRQRRVLRALRMMHLVVSLSEDHDPQLLDIDIPSPTNQIPPSLRSPFLSPS